MSFCLLQFLVPDVECLKVLESIGSALWSPGQHLEHRTSSWISRRSLCQVWDLGWETGTTTAADTELDLLHTLLILSSYLHQKEVSSAPLHLVFVQK